MIAYNKKLVDAVEAAEAAYEQAINELALAEAAMNEADDIKNWDPIRAMTDPTYQFNYPIDELMAAQGAAIKAKKALDSAEFEKAIRWARED